jgi:hypothetical protein
MIDDVQIRKLTANTQLCMSHRSSGSPAIFESPEPPRAGCLIPPDVASQPARSTSRSLPCGGLPISEAVRLKPAAIDSKRMVIRFNKAKAGKTAMSCCRPSSSICSGTIGSAPVLESGCFPVAGPAAGLSTHHRSHLPEGEAAVRASTNLLPRIRCATLLRCICWRPAPICVPLACWVTPYR